MTYTSHNTSISIVVPVHNRASIMLPTLQSIVAQTYRPLHLVLVDNNSSDGSLSALLRFRQEHEGEGLEITVLSESKPGATAARNAGFRAGESEWVMFFDSDDLMDPDLVESYMSRIEAVDDAADLVVTRVDVKMLNGNVREYPYYEDNLLVHHLFHASLATQRFIARRSLIERAGGWNEALPCWNDWEFGFRLLMQHPRIAFVGDRVRVHVIATAESITGTSFTAKHGKWEQSVNAVETLLQASGEPMRATLLKWLDFRRIALAAEYCRERRPDLARPLYQATMSHCRRHLVMSWLYPLCYHYIACGGRGISHLVKHLVR